MPTHEEFVAAFPAQPGEEIKVQPTDVVFEPLPEIREIASMIIQENLDDHTFWAWVRVDGGEGEWIEVPPHIVAQLPMAIAAIQQFKS
jgi:hypothetical protein